MAPRGRSGTGGGNGASRRVRGVSRGNRAGSGAGNEARERPRRCRAPGAALPWPPRAPSHGRPVSPQTAIAPRLRCRSCSSSTAGTVPHIFSWKRSCSCTKVSPSLQSSCRSRRDGRERGAEGGAFPAVLLLPYPVSNLVLDVVLLLLYLGIEATRIFFGSKGNLCQRKVPLSLSLALTVPAAVLAVYYLLLQTYSLRLEAFLSAILLLFYGLELLLGVLALLSFSSTDPY
uniref:Transmembrane protein 216 n=2 Tax=Passeriformes TaxID=9126 RepID=A0A8C5NL32_JUNHY